MHDTFNYFTVIVVATNRKLFNELMPGKREERKIKLVDCFGFLV